MNSLHQRSALPGPGWGQHRFSMLQLLISLALLFFCAPFVEDRRAGGLIEAALMSLALLSGVVAVANHRWTLIIGLALIVPGLTARWIHYLFPDVISIMWFLICGLLLIGFVVANLVRFILRAGVVDHEVICASLSAYVMLGLGWSLAYWLIAEVNPQAFSFNAPSGVHDTMKALNAFYFSFITLSSVGYGDITPATKVTRMLAAMEGITGMLYVAVMIARLVALYSAPNSRDASTE
ncbi:MAG: potassium channel family protein [Chthoniobacterales bacterium]